MVYRFGASGRSSTDPAKARSGNPSEGMAGPQEGRGLMDWLKRRVLAAALSAAATITFLSLISPAWLDFMFDLIMVGLIALVGKLAKD